MKVVVVGGGIIGMLTARELQLQGAEVTLVERRKTGRESSWAGGGIISPLYPWRYADCVTSLATRSQAVYPQLTEALQEESGIDPEYIRSGLLIFAPDEIDDAISWARKHNSKLELIPPYECKFIEPKLEVPAEQGIWLPRIAQVRNPRLTVAARKSIENLGVEIVEDEAVTGFREGDGKITAVVTEKQTLHADKIVVCAGAWTAELLEEYLSAMEIKPVRGQMLLFNTGDPTLIRSIVLWKDRYIIPRRDGRILFGSTLEQEGFIKETTGEARSELFERATELFPLLKDAPIEHHWAGLRPGSPAGIPYIGQHPELENLYFNAGHFRNGVVLGPASIELLLDIMLERKSRFNAAEYAVDAPRIEPA